MSTARESNNIDNQNDHLRNQINEHNNHTDENSRSATLLKGVYLIAILVLCVLLSSPILLLPQHDAIRHPEYWYESMLVGVLSIDVTITLETLVIVWGYLKIDSMISFPVFMKLYAPLVFLWIVIFCSVNMAWTVGTGNNSPVPFSLLLGIVPWFFQYVLLYFLIPKHVMNEDIKKKYRAFLISRAWALFFEQQLRGLSFLFTIIPPDIQWILAFLIPSIREINYHIIYHIMMSFLDMKDGEDGIIISVNAFSSLYVAITLGQRATQTTLICVLAIDFILNLYSCHSIVRLHRSINPEAQDTSKEMKNRKYHLNKLIYTEMMEVLIPILYAVTVLIAYYGPNAEVLGNIKNDYWQYEKIDDIGTLIGVQALMFAIDSCSAVMVGIWLWRSCNIDFLMETCRLIGTWWLPITIIIANHLNIVSKIIIYQTSFDTVY